MARTGGIGPTTGARARIRHSVAAHRSYREDAENLLPTTVGDGAERVPDQTMVLRFWRLLEKQGLACWQSSIAVCRSWN